MQDFTQQRKTSQNAVSFDGGPSRRPRRAAVMRLTRPGQPALQNLQTPSTLVLSLLVLAAACENAPFDAQEFRFGGLKSAETPALGEIVLSWDAVPQEGVEYAVYERGQKDAGYNFNEPVARTSLTTHRLTGYAFKADRCFVVRYLAPGLEPDQNKTEICVDHEQFEFPGLSALQQTASGSFVALWPSVPLDAVTFSLFMRDADGAPFDLSRPLVSETSSLSAVLPNLSLAEPKCFWVRANYPPGTESKDTNQKEICSTDADRYVYPGLSSLTANADGTYTLNWPKAAVAGTRYNVYQRPQAGAYSFAAPIVADSELLSHVTQNLSLAGDQCFVVRASYPAGSETADENLKELCTGDPGVVDFGGCTGVTTLDASSARVDFAWPERAEEMLVYKNGSLVFTTSDRAVSSFVAPGLTPGVPAQFECGAKRKGLTLKGPQTVTGAALSPSEFSTYEGCVSGAATGVNEIQISFVWPTATQLKGYAVSEMRIKRSGVTVGVITNQGTTTFADKGLQEGFPYSYSCAALIAGLEVEGSRRLSNVKTLQANPPLFDGLASATAAGSSSVLVRWNPARPESVAVDRFSLYGNPGATVDTTAAPLAEFSATTFQHTVTGVGEELLYSFALKACSSLLDDGVTRLCAWGRSGTEPLSTLSPSLQKQITLPDTGAPQTVGATSVAMSGGRAEIAAPWSPSLGGLSKRLVFYKQGAPSAQFSDYTSSRVFAVSDATNPPTTLAVDGLSGGTDYSFLVRDEDVAGNRNSSLAVVSANTGDLTPPAFSGGGTLSHGASPSTSVTLNFTAVAPEVLTPANNQGASTYLVYLTQAAGTTTPADPCAAGGTAVQQVAASGHAAGQTVTLTLPGLSPRTTYRACVKARDAAGNVSSTTTPATPAITTRDTTAPVFDGLQSLSFDAGQTCLRLEWVASPAADLKEYVIALWKDDNLTPAVLTYAAAAPELVVNNQTVSLCLPKTAYDFSDTPATAGNTVSAYVNACDDAAPLFGAQNCSSFSAANKKSVAIPDTDPPPGFAGIAAVGPSSPATSGAVTVSWGFAAGWNWPEARGFKVYDLNPTDLSLTLLKDCPCAQADCSDQPASCSVAGLTPYKEYRFFVRAYDTTGNQTAVGTSPFSIAARADDATPPTFASGLSASWVTGATATCSTGGNGVCLAWAAATDNQVSTESVWYRVYRKAGSAPAFSSGLPVGATLLTTTQARVFKDPGSGLTGGADYHYTVCALDAATLAAATVNGGPTCDGVVRAVTAPDLTPPSVFNVALTQSSASLASPTWSLSWALSDNLDPAGQLVVAVRRIDTPVSGAGSTDFPSGNETPVSQSLGLTALAAQTGVGGQHRRIAYRITATDQQGNSASVTAAITADLSTPTAPAITSLSQGERVQQFALHSVTGTCDSTAGYSTTVSLAAGLVPGAVHNVSCVSGVLTFDLHLAAGSDPNLTLSLTTTKANGNSISSTHSLDFHRPCPSGYIGVAGLNGTSGSGNWNDPLLNAGLGNASATYGNASPWLDPGRDFCVMKYPAKAQTSPSNPEGGFIPIARGEQSFTMNNVIPDSRASGRPWTNITQTQSLSECSELNSVLLGSANPALGSFGLISNTQWQVLARSVEATASNWSGGAVGSGTLARGHTDNAMGASAALDGADINGTGLALSHPPIDSNGFYGTGQSSDSGAEQRRTQALPNGQVVWDLGGNIWQWVRDLRSELGIPGADDAAGLSTVASSSLRNGGSNRFSETSNRIFGNFGTFGNPRLQFSESQNMGQLYAGTGGAVLRGGDWNGGSNAGAFAANLDVGSGVALTGIGFRCSLPLAGFSGTDMSVPEISFFRRANASSEDVPNTAVTVATGGNWNLAWNLSDTGDAAAELWVQVRRKASDDPTDFPTLTDSVYAEGFGLNRLVGENGWVQNPTTGQFTVHNGKRMNYLVTATDRSGNRSDPEAAAARLSVQITQSCPPGYIGVAGLNGTSGSGNWNDPQLNAGLGNASATYGNASPWLDPGRDFCVMKYPAKAQTSPSNPEGGFIPIARGEQSLTLNNVIPDSRASGRPWTNISQTNSLSECSELNTVLLGSANPALGSFGLISNTQWQVLARSVEATASNWSSGAVGSGTIARGHTDNAMGASAALDGADINGTGLALSHPPTDSNGFYGTGQSSGSGAEQRRTQTLPNGQVVWDLGGNIWQWVRDLRSELGIPGADDAAGLSTVAWSSLRNGGSNRFSETSNRIFGNFGTFGNPRLQFSESQNMGQLYAGTGGAVLRGGPWSSGSLAGAFAATLHAGSGGAGTNIGFRCSLAFSETP